MLISYACANSDNNDKISVLLEKIIILLVERVIKVGIFQCCFNLTELVGFFFLFSIAQQLVCGLVATEQLVEAYGFTAHFYLILFIDPSEHLNTTFIT